MTKTVYKRSGAPEPQQTISPEIFNSGDAIALKSMRKVPTLGPFLSRFPAD